MHAFAVAFLLMAGTVPDAMEKLDGSFTRLKEAQTGTDAAKVQSLAGDVWTASREIIAEPEPQDAESKDAWKKRIAWAREINLHTEYAVSVAALRAANPADTISLLATLEKQNPKSKYLDDAYAAYFIALNKSGAAAKIPAVAENALKSFPNNEDCLLVLADRAVSRNETDRALTYSERLLTALAAHPKPEGMQAADWEKKRSTLATRAHFIAGVMHATKLNYYEADKDLRDALPNVKDNPAMLATTLFHLGVANYQLGMQLGDRPRILQASKFSDEASRIPGPLSQQAWRNAQIMRQEALKVR